MRTVSLASLLGVLCLLAAAPRRARAEDAPPLSPAKKLLAEIEAAKTAKDDAKWIEGLKRIPAVYPDADDDADKKALAAAAGFALKAKTDSVQNAALDALV